MKNWIFKASTMAFAAGLVGTLACGSSSSCGGTNLNTNAPGTTMSMSCGAGTYVLNNQCVPLPSATGTSGSAKPAATGPVN